MFGEPKKIFFFLFFLSKLCTLVNCTKEMLWYKFWSSSNKIPFLWCHIRFFFWLISVLSSLKKHVSRRKKYFFFIFSASNFAHLFNIQRRWCGIIFVVLSQKFNLCGFLLSQKKKCLKCKDPFLKAEKFSNQWIFVFSSFFFAPNLAHEVATLMRSFGVTFKVTI